MKSTIFSFILGSIVSMAAGTVLAESHYPVRSIRLIFGFPAGNDVNVRLVADKLAQGLGKPVIVENVTGAAGNIAADRTARAAPDGYTVGILGVANIVLRPLIHKALPHDPRKELVPVSLAFRFSNILVVSNHVQVSTLSELLSRAQASPGKLTLGHLGMGSVTHLSGELLKATANVTTLGVPYRGASALLTDLVSGQIAVAFIPPPTALPLIQGGMIRALAVTSQTRIPFAPEIPTMAELGYPNFDMSVWFGVFVPVGTPQSIIDRLNMEIAKVMRQPDVREAFIRHGQEAIGSTQSDFERGIDAETSFWAQLINDAGILPIAEKDSR